MCQYQLQMDDDDDDDAHAESVEKKKYEMKRQTVDGCALDKLAEHAL